MTVGVFPPKCHSIEIQNYLSLKCVTEASSFLDVKYMYMLMNFIRKKEDQNK